MNTLENGKITSGSIMKFDYMPKKVGNFRENCVEIHYLHATFYLGNLQKSNGLF